MSNSPLVVYTKISPNSTNPRRDKIRKITIHHVAGNCSVETIGAIFAPSSRQASSNYGVGTDGRIGMYVEEKNRAWTSSSAANDNQAVTIEVSNIEIGGNWRVSDKALAATIDLCVDICKRNGIEKLNFTGDAKGNLTQHNYFANTNCPGPYLGSKFPYIAEEVNKRLGATEPQKAPTVFKVGAIVDFRGTTHYANAGATSGAKCKAGRAKVTQVYPTGKHPYHLIAEKGGGSTVYGWVDTADIIGAAAPATPTAPVKIVKGSKVKIKPGAKYYSGGAIPAWVMSDTWIVSDLKGDRAVINKNVSGKNAINSPINVNNLNLV